MEQLDLGRPYQRKSQTSRDAAAALDEPTLKSLEGQVLALLRERGPMTDTEMQRALSISGDTQRPRRVTLVRKELVRDSGRQAPGARGRMATLWEAV